MEKRNLAELNGTTGMETIQQNGVSTQKIRLNFSDPTQREAHLKAFLAWLPQPLHRAPGIQWGRLPSKTMGYLILSVADGPDAIPIALAMGCAMNGVKNSTLLSYCNQLTRLLKRLRAQYGLRELTQLGTRSIWEQYALPPLPAGFIDKQRQHSLLPSSDGRSSPMSWSLCFRCW
jgi:hypothetical protein